MTRMTAEQREQAKAPLREVVQRAHEAQLAVTSLRNSLERGLRMANSWELGDAAFTDDLLRFRKALLHFDALLEERDRLVSDLRARGVFLSSAVRGAYLRRAS